MICKGGNKKEINIEGRGKRGKGMCKEAIKRRDIKGRGYRGEMIWKEGDKEGRGLRREWQG